MKLILQTERAHIHYCAKYIYLFLKRGRMKGQKRLKDRDYMDVCVCVKEDSVRKNRRLAKANG